MNIFLKRVLPILVVFAISILIVIVLIKTRPKPEKKAAEIKVTLVEVIQAITSSENIIVEARGTVLPAKELNLMPEVSGKITEINPALVPGGHVKEGDVLLKIDDRDYKASVKQARASVSGANAALKLEKGLQKVAKTEWEQMSNITDVSGKSSDLALRKPQLASARASLSSAYSMLDQAKLRLERTTIKSPINAGVRAESVEVGQLVGPQSVVARLVGSDKYWVQVSVPVSSLSMIKLPDENGEGGAKAVVHQDIGNEKMISRDGKVIRMLGDLEVTGRLARLLIEIDDPLGKNLGDEAGIPLLLNAYVKVEIEGNILENVYVVSRKAISQGDNIYIMDSENKLDIRKVDIAWGREDDVLIKSGIKAGDKIVTSGLPSPLPGMLLTTGEEDSTDATDN
jgi:RND family efflux transporter MFP subunit